MWVAASQSWVAQLDEVQGRALAQYVEALRAKYVEEARRCGELPSTPVPTTGCWASAAVTNAEAEITRTARTILLT